MIERYIDIREAPQLCPIEWASISMVPNQLLYAILAGKSNRNSNASGTLESGVESLCAYREHAQDQASIDACVNSRGKGRERKRKRLELEDSAGFMVG